MALTPAKQISKPMAATVAVAGFTTAGGTSDTITAALTTVLSTAGNLGVSVPLAVGSATAEGVDTASGFNLAKIYASATGKNYQDGNGNDVYGKVTNAGSAWTLSYFSAPNGVEAAFAIPASASIAFDVPYIFSLSDLPMRAITGTAERHVAPDLAAYGFRAQADVMTVTSANTLSAMSQTFVGPYSQLIVNNQTFTPYGTSPDYTVTGTTVTWSASNVGFALAPGDKVIHFYAY